jgi:hypothetical protein
MLRNSPTLRIAPAPGNTHSNPSLLMYCTGMLLQLLAVTFLLVSHSELSLLNASVTAGAYSRLTIQLTAMHTAEYELIDQTS